MSMLHNSLFRHDRLLAMNRNPLVLKRREIHRNVGCLAGAKAAAGQFELTGAWSIRSANNTPAERAVAADAEDFLKRLDMTIDSTSSKQMVFAIGGIERGFRCAAAETRVEVNAADASSLWAAWVHLENQMRSAGGAILSAAEETREPAWNLQIAPPTWG